MLAYWKCPTEIYYFNEHRNVEVEKTIDELIEYAEKRLNMSESEVIAIAAAWERIKQEVERCRACNGYPNAVFSKDERIGGLCRDHDCCELDDDIDALFDLCALVHPVYGKELETYLMANFMIYISYEMPDGCGARLIFQKRINDVLYTDTLEYKAAVRRCKNRHRIKSLRRSGIKDEGLNTSAEEQADRCQIYVLTLTS